VVKELEHRVIRHGDIDRSVAIEVANGNPEAFARKIHVDFLRDIPKASIAIIVVNERGDGRKYVRVAVGSIPFTVLAAPYVVKVPYNVAEDNQVELAVIVDIDPCG
jgi:hypothetical protein